MSKKRFSVSAKMRVFVEVIVISVSILIAATSFIVSSNQMDNYFKRMAEDSAENFSTMIDREYLSRLKETLESKEYQDMRDKAEIDNNDGAVENYLKEKGLWEEFVPLRQKMCTYLKNMEDIKYLYITVLGDSSALRDMYLVDDDSFPLYNTGNFYSRDAELVGVDLSQKIEPFVSHSEWGWLYSAYVPVYDKDGNLICHVGCDVDMERVVSERIWNLVIISVSTIVIMLIVLLIAIIFNHKIFIKPLHQLTEESKKFSPAKDVTYEEAGVVQMYFKNDDEISEIYEVIRSMQMSMIDYLNAMAKMDVLMAALVYFTSAYCKGLGDRHRRPTAMYVLLSLDSIQLLLNMVFGHAFAIEKINAYDDVFYRMIPLNGQMVHRVVDYFVFLCVILIFL